MGFNNIRHSYFVVSTYVTSADTIRSPLRFADFWIAVPFPDRSVVADTANGRVLYGRSANQSTKRFGARGFWGFVFECRRRWRASGWLAVTCVLCAKRKTRSSGQFVWVLSPARVLDRTFFRATCEFPGAKLAFVLFGIVRSSGSRRDGPRAGEPLQHSHGPNQAGLECASLRSQGGRAGMPGVLSVGL
jgi:hypothetical protein